jgi:methylated-DNA-protein-cysteine methyltransferase-like protein
VISVSDLTDFQQRLVEVLNDIPEGSVVTYGQLADLAGSSGAARAAGSAMKKDFAADYPCWRVVGSDGSLHESAIGGPEEQHDRLKREGVEFEDESTVDLETSQYSGSAS